MIVLSTRDFNLHVRVANVKRRNTAGSCSRWASTHCHRGVTALRLAAA